MKTSRGTGLTWNFCAGVAWASASALVVRVIAPAALVARNSRRLTMSRGFTGSSSTTDDERNENDAETGPAVGRRALRRAARPYILPPMLPQNTYVETSCADLWPLI